MSHGFFINTVGALTNNLFVKLTYLGYAWEPAASTSYNLRNRTTCTVEHRATRADLVFGSNSILPSYARVHAQDDSREKFVHDFVAAWKTVLKADRFDLVARSPAAEPVMDARAGVSAGASALSLVGTFSAQAARR
ncbi:hypothetical protein [Microcella pacifica]|uniref:Catalase-peroxidase n=1 Tax=Microcella pacifica TaxID=2591847 RepID=A0A9E5JWW3_9MICO|nr:hypothetical protein [Microcella pacifica]NHF63838.1 hypothetical protein [Microcella pacifica]